MQQKWGRESSGLITQSIRSDVSRLGEIEDRFLFSSLFFLIILLLIKETFKINFVNKNKGLHVKSPLLTFIHGYVADIETVIT